MGIAERKARQRRDLQRRVLQSAEELFVREGYENVSMRKIAQRIEYSPTTIYRLFRNKAEIMDQLIAEGYRRVYQRYEEILARRPDSPFETLSLIITEYVVFALNNPNHYRLWFATGELQLHDEALRMRHGSLSYQVYRTWLDRIEECKADGSLPRRDTLALFQLIWGSVHGLISLRIHHSDFPWLPLEQHIAEVLSLLKRGLNPESGGAPAGGGGAAK